MLPYHILTILTPEHNTSLPILLLSNVQAAFPSLRDVQLVHRLVKKTLWLWSIEGRMLGNVEEDVRQCPLALTSHKDSDFRDVLPAELTTVLHDEVAGAETVGGA